LTAIACAAAGAWLGYQVPHAPGFGAVTAVIGAILAANLGLIAVDIAAPVTAEAAVPGSAQAKTVAGSA
jgi:phage tail protein X